MIPIPLQTVTRIGLNVLLLLAAVLALHFGQPVVVPLIIALLLAAVLWPAVMWIHEKLKIRWSLACLTVIFGLVLVNLVLTLAFSLAISRLVQQLPAPNDRDQMISVYKNFRGKLATVSPWELDPVLFPEAPTEVSEIRVYQILSESAPWVIRAVFEHTRNWLWQWLLILFILLFFLLEGRMLTRRVVDIFGPSEEIRTRVGSVLRDMATQVRTYIVWRTIINFGLALVMGLIYQFAGLHQAWTWAMLLAIFNYVPYLGPLVAGIPPFIDAFLSTTPGGALAISVVYVIVIMLEGWLVVPLLMGRSMDLNATTVMLACLFWDLVWGMTGLFLAMPIMAGVKAILYHVPEWRVWANLMSTDRGEPEGVITVAVPATSPANGAAASSTFTNASP